MELKELRKRKELRKKFDALYLKNKASREFAKSIFLKWANNDNKSLNKLN